MKKIVVFDYPEDESDFVVFNSGRDMAFIISDMDTYLRSKIKYEELSEEQYKLYQEVRDKLRELVNERDVGNIIWG